MDNPFDNIYPIAEHTKNPKFVKLEMEVNKLRLCLQMSQKSDFQRKEAMGIMRTRLEEQEDLIRRMDRILKYQKDTITKLEEIIDKQKEQLAHIDTIDNRMSDIHNNQGKILKFASKYQRKFN